MALPTSDHTVRPEQDPRTHTDGSVGAAYIEEAVREAVAEIRGRLLAGGRA
jgi:hypothetical protein